MWKITPLDVGTLYVTRSAQIARHGAKNHVGDLVAEPLIAWLLTNLDTGRKILVDAGSNDDVTWVSKYHNRMEQTPEQTLKGALALHGLTCDDIDTVILTHLHWDHAQGAVNLPHAKLYVQRKELQYAVSPLPTDKMVYENDIGDDLPFFLKVYKQYEFLDGDVMFDDGIEIITLPGHSPGSQGVVVDTVKGKVIIPGDLVFLVEGWKSRIPAGLFLNMEECHQSFEKMARYHATVVGCHDYASFDMLKD